jgi:hypothetical protein
LGFGKTYNRNKPRRKDKVMATIGAGTIESLFTQLYKDYVSGREKGLRPLERMAGLYGPGYMAGQERLALTGAKEALGARGLGGTTRPQAVSAGMKTGFEDVRRQGLADALARISAYHAGTTPTAGELSHLVTGGFSGMLGERGMRLQELAATAGRPTLGPMASQGRDVFGRPLGGGLGGIGIRGGAGYTVSGADYNVGRIGGAVARAGETAKPWEPIQWEALEEGLPEGYAKTPTGAEYVSGEATATTAGEPKPDLSTTYQEWKAEIQRRYPGKPVMPQSRWEKLIYPKMGIV